MRSTPLLCQEPPRHLRLWARRTGHRGLAATPAGTCFTAEGREGVQGTQGTGCRPHGWVQAPAGSTCFLPLTSHGAWRPGGVQRPGVPSDRGSPQPSPSQHGRKGKESHGSDGKVKVSLPGGSAGTWGHQGLPHPARKRRPNATGTPFRDRGPWSIWGPPPLQKGRGSGLQVGQVGRPRQGPGWGVGRCCRPGLPRVPRPGCFLSTGPPAPTQSSPLRSISLGIGGLPRVRGQRRAAAGLAHRAAFRTARPGPTLPGTQGRHRGPLRRRQPAPPAPPDLDAAGPRGDWF